MQSAQQVEHLLKLLPSTASNSSSIGNRSEDTDEELDYSFASIAVCLHAEHEYIDWVIDTGATDHMTSESRYLSSVKTVSYTHLTLPTNREV